jgi:hypothetical protein
MSAGKMAFSYVRGTKLADCEDSNAKVAFSKLANRYATKMMVSLAKTNRLFYEARLKKQDNPDIFITYIEGLPTRMEHMDSFITGKEFNMHVMNNVNKGYDNGSRISKSLLVMKSNLS